jgi:hypothetical protein
MVVGFRASHCDPFVPRSAFNSSRFSQNSTRPTKESTWLNKPMHRTIPLGFRFWSCLPATLQT